MNDTAKAWKTDYQEKPTWNLLTPDYQDYVKRFDDAFSKLLVEDDVCDSARNLDGFNQWVLMGPDMVNSSIEKRQGNYFQSLLSRNKRTHNRPSREIEVYAALLQAVAAAYDTNQQGEFTVDTTATVTHQTPGATYSVNTQELLDYSGVVNRSPLHQKPAVYSFEPLWLHRYLAERHRADQKICGVSLARLCEAKVAARSSGTAAGEGGFAATGDDVRATDD